MAIDHLRDSLDRGGDWPTALLEAMALWTLPRESLRGRVYNYLIGGEAFDWQLLAERLCDGVHGLVPEQEVEELLFTGRFPPTFDRSRLKDLLGVDKYRGYLNYYYGVTVEEALQLAIELEVLKRHTSNGIQYREDFTEEAFARIYGEPRDELLRTFRRESGYPDRPSIGLSESKEFTYWLFKYRLAVRDRARIASDIRKGLEQLRRMREATWTSADAPRDLPAPSEPHLVGASEPVK